MDDWQLRLIVDLGKPVIIHRADIEIAALAGAAQIELRNGLGRDAGLKRIEFRGDLLELVVVDVLAVGRQKPGPAPHPFVGDCKLSGALNGAAKVIGGRARRTVAGGEVARIRLENTGCPDRVGAVQEPMPPFAIEHRALFRRQIGVERQIVIGRERPEIFGLDSVAVLRGLRDAWEQKAAFTFDGRIGRRHERHVSQRHAEELDAGVLEIEHFLALIVNDAGGLHLP